ncbi:MAG: MASE1 domain-containing protein [Candidatus Acidiferrales bacterium]
MTLSPKLVPARDGSVELQRSLAAKLRLYLAPVNLALNAAVAAAYFVIARLGLHPETPNHSVTAIWLPAGISLAAFLLWGNRVWPGVYLGAVLITFSIIGSFPLALVFAANVTLSDLLGASLINKFAHGSHAFFKTGDVLRFIFFGAVFTPALCATVGVSLLCATGFAKPADFSTLWFTWWVGDMLGILFLTPFLVLLLGHKHHSSALTERLEMTALVTGLSMMCVLNFGLRPVSWIPGNGFLFLCAPFLVWAALRFCPLEAAGAALIMGGFAAWGSLHGLGPFQSPVSLPLFVGGFMAVGTAMTITIAAANAEQKSATKDVLGMYCVLKDVKEGEIRVLQDTVEALQIELARRGSRRTPSSSPEGIS